MSLVYDFFARTMSGGDITPKIAKLFPYPEECLEHPLLPHLLVRTLRLTSISSHYGSLWKDSFTDNFLHTSLDLPNNPKLPNSSLDEKWCRDSCIRHPLAREQALSEMDAIVAIMMGISKETLIDLYRSQFGVLQAAWQDLPDQKIAADKESFERAKTMCDAYDQLVKLLSKSETKAA